MESKVSLESKLSFHILCSVRNPSSFEDIAKIVDPLEKLTNMFIELVVQVALVILAGRHRFTMRVTRRLRPV